MKFPFAAVTALCAAFVNALPAPEVEARQVPYIPCAGTYSNAQCCATDVLGLADLDCANRECEVLDMIAQGLLLTSESKQPLLLLPTPRPSRRCALTLVSVLAAAPSRL
jgi:Fungal hydrophobin